MLNLDDIRRQFPALQRVVAGEPAAYFDGPAGSQVPRRVAEAVARYLLETNANHGGPFATSRESDALLDSAHRRLAEFLGRLPHGPLYAIELRDPALITDAYLQALHGSGAHHCLGLHPRMPVASEQARATGLAHAGPLVVRWNLHQGFGYEEAKARYQPFTRLVDEDIPNRVSLARLCLDAVGRGQPAFVIANNKAEGSAPLTLFKLAEQIVTAAAHAKAERRSG